MATEEVYVKGTEREREESRASSRHILAKADYCATLAADFGIELDVVRECLEGEPMKRAYKLCLWAERAGGGVLEERERALRNFARKHRIGRYRAGGKCDGCYRRFPRRELTEVTEDHESLTWFEHDLICERCAIETGVL